MPECTHCSSTSPPRPFPPAPLSCSPTCSRTQLQVTVEPPTAARVFFERLPHPGLLRQTHAVLTRRRASMRASVRIHTRRPEKFYSSTFSGSYVIWWHSSPPSPPIFFSQRGPVRSLTLFFRTRTPGCRVRRPHAIPLSTSTARLQASPRSLASPRRLPRQWKSKGAHIPSFFFVARRRAHARLLPCTCAS